MSGFSSGLSWNRCFLCSSPVVVQECGRKGNGGVKVEKEGLGSVKLLMKYLLHDFELERGLSSRVIAQWTSEAERIGAGAGEGGGADDGGGFWAKLCSYCGTLVRSVTELQLKLEVIQMRIVSGLEAVKKAVISNSRLYGGNDGVKQDFDVLEGKLLEREAAGGDCSRGRMFLDVIHHFQTFVFENDSKQSHIPLVYLEKLTGHKMTVALSSGLNLEPAMNAAGTIKKEPDDYSESMDDVHDFDPNYDLELPGPLPEVKLEQETTDTSSTRRRSRRSTQLASARLKESLKKPKPKPPPPQPKRHLTQAQLLYRAVREEKRVVNQRKREQIRKGGWQPPKSKDHRRGRPGNRHIPLNQRFKCDECGHEICTNKMTSLEEQHLREHEETPEEKRNYECPDCKIGFKQKQYFELHLSYHCRTLECEVCKDRVPFLEMESHLRTHQERIFGCGYCSLWTATFESLAAHLSHHTNITVKCELCPPDSNFKKYGPKRDLRRHLSECHAKTEFQLKCPMDGCSQVFYSTTTLNAHLTVHKGCYKCSVCSKSFPSDDNLQKHTRKEHPDQIKLWFWCDVYTCLSKFATESALHRHQMLQHDKPKLKCKMCPMEFLTKGALGSHQRTKHIDEEELAKLVCTICGVQLSCTKRLKTHLATHNKNEKNFTCEICGFATHSDDNLRRHKEVHKADRERKHACPYCPDKFYESCTLKIHIRRHTLERPYQCDACGATFNQRPALNVHKKKHCGGKFGGRGPRPRALNNKKTEESLEESLPQTESQSVFEAASPPDVFESTDAVLANVPAGPSSTLQNNPTQDLPPVTVFGVPAPPTLE